MLEGGNTCYIDGRIPTYTEEVGKNITVECSVFRYGGNKLFCKEKCEEGNVLIETTDNSAQRGRYSMEHRNYMHYVSITQLKKSDSGRYRCLLRPSSISAPHDDFEIAVTEGEFLVEVMKAFLHFCFTETTTVSNNLICFVKMCSAIKRSNCSSHWQKHFLCSGIIPAVSLFADDWITSLSYFTYSNRM